MRTALVVLAASILVFAISLGVRSYLDDGFEDRCDVLGGEVFEKPKTKKYTEVDGDGKFVVKEKTKTIRRCVVDGQVVARS